MLHGILSISDVKKAQRLVLLAGHGGEIKKKRRVFRKVGSVHGVGIMIGAKNGKYPKGDFSHADPAVTERLLPHNRDAERSLLSTMLRDPTLIREIVNLVKADHFYVFGHQKIFEAMISMDRVAADVVTIAEWLTQRKLIEDVGGHAYLLSFAKRSDKFPADVIQR